MADQNEETGEDMAQTPNVRKDDIIFDTENPNRARAVPRGDGKTVLEQARARAPRRRGTYPDIVEGSDSARTGTSWGVLPVEGGPEPKNTAERDEA